MTMTYKNGRNVNPGDYAIGKLDGVAIAGKIHELTGNCVILYPIAGRTIFAPINPAEFYHAQDALEACDLINSKAVVPIKQGEVPADQSAPTVPSTSTASAPAAAAPVINAPAPTIPTT